MEVRARTQDKKLEAGISAETMEECCLLTCVSWLSQSISYSTEDHQPRDDTIPIEVDTPILIKNDIQACIETNFKE